MPANLKRMLPIVLIMVVVLFIVPQLMKKKKTAGPDAAARATQTLDAMKLVDAGEQAYLKAHGMFTSSVADLLQPGTKLAGYLASGIAVRIDAGTDGQQFTAEVTSDVLRVFRARGGGKVLAQSCVVIKRTKGVVCPVPTA